MSLTFALQALLARHEAYMAEAEEERRKMGASFTKLEIEKTELKVANAKTIDENRYLLDQLEQLNNAVSNSDATILSLNTTLLSTRKELERLTVLASQAAHLEAQLASMELGQADLQQTVAIKQEEERSAVQRWKGAERTIGALQEQVDRIEREAREERGRHAEVVARFERQRAVERELESAAGRLKGAAAATTLGRQDGNSNVVSHFVKDILQDNANLQLGIVELREMLMGSNEEVENLREQMIFHQPLPAWPEEPETRQSLNSELSRTPADESIPDFHVHHHYHAAPPKAEILSSRLPGLRRQKKRRIITPSGLRTPSFGTQTPRTPSAHSVRAVSPSAASTILSQTSVTIPPTSNPSHSGQWSTQSSQIPSAAASSIPSSPQSAFRSASYDSMNDTMDLSRPTTPGSTILGSPETYPRHVKRGSDVSIRSLSLQSPGTVPQSLSGVLQPSRRGFKDGSEVPTPFPLLEHSAIFEEPEDDGASQTSRTSTTDTHQSLDLQEDYMSTLQRRPKLHRASSHESLLSIRGIDVPGLEGKHAQRMSGQRFNPGTSLGISRPSVGPVTSSTTVVARSSQRANGYDSSNYNRILLSNTTLTSPTTNTQTEKATFGRLVGGWITGKWGVTPTASTGDLRAKAALSSIHSRSTNAKQKGSIRNEKETNRLSTHIEPVSVDSNLLQESLDEV